LSLNEANTGKLAQLDRVMTEALRVLNGYIDVLWATKSTNKFASIKLETWLTARLQQCMLKQAAEVVKSQRKKVHKTQPVVTKRTINLDERFLSFAEDVNSFDFWVKIASLGNKIIVNLPADKHRHFNSHRTGGWTMRKAGRLRQNSRGWFLDVYMEKDAPAVKTSGSAVGLDTGYKKLLADSNGAVHDVGLEAVYEKIARKKQGSKAFDRALIERDQKINQTINQMDLAQVKTLVVEDLKSVKSGSRGRMRKDFNNKLQRWSYPKVLGKLQSVCEVQGIDFKKVDPAYTSQTCSACGFVDKASRKGGGFCCTKCGMQMDADVNAAKNILMRGAYSPPSGQCNEIPF
jgi:IS605 OrfB family transposase